MTASAWPWVYKEGMTGTLEGNEDQRRRYFGIEALKHTLVIVGYDPQNKINLDTGKFGGNTRNAVKAFQQAETDAGHKIGGVDGVVGRNTANALFREVYHQAESGAGVPRELLRAHCHWESGDDPGAELVNGDLSRDRGLTQANDAHDGVILSDDQAFDPQVAVAIRAGSIANYAKAFEGASPEVVAPDGTHHTFDAWDVAVSAHRTPVGAKMLAVDPDPVTAKRRQDGGTWEEAAAYYCVMVNTGGRQGWVG